MIDDDTSSAILRHYYADNWKVGTISRQLSIHRDTVKRVLSEKGQLPGDLAARSSIIDAYLPYIMEVLGNFPNLNSKRLYDMVKVRGYPGGPDHFRHLIRQYRPRPAAEAYHRLKTFPGEQAQVDWGDFGPLIIGRARRRLMAFVMVLSWSRKVFLQFFPDAQMANFLRGHEGAFTAFGGVPRVLLYDNLKSAVLERRGDAIRFHPTLLGFAGHYRYEPRPVAVRRGNEKGRVERAIRTIRASFFAAREWSDLDDLNRQAMDWCQGPNADRRCPEDTTLTVREAFEQEQPQLMALPDNPYPTDEQVIVKIGKTPYARFDRNDYSVPHTHVRSSRTVVASPTRVRILDGATVVADHERSYDHGRQIEDPQHIAALTAVKQEARQHRGQDRLLQAIPDARYFLAKAAERGDNLGSVVSSLLRYLDHYGQSDLAKALTEALEKEVPHINAVRQALERYREKPTPAVTVPVPDKASVAVRPHDLKDYDNLGVRHDG